MAVVGWSIEADQLSWCQQPFEDGAGTPAKLADLQFAQASFFHDDPRNWFSGQEHRNEQAQIRLMANDQNAFDRLRSGGDQLCQLPRAAFRSKFVTQLKRLFEFENLSHNFRRLFGSRVGTGENPVKLQIQLHHGLGNASRFLPSLLGQWTIAIAALSPIGAIQGEAVAKDVKFHLDSVWKMAPAWAFPLNRPSGTFSPNGGRRMG